MLKWMKGLLLGVIGMVIVTFAVSNREPVTVSLFPLPFEAELPLYILLFALFITGIIVGGMVMYTHSLRWRKVAKQEKQQAQALANELEGWKLQPKMLKELPRQ